jgi:dipeptidyl aminopeptidase/acylaminoacyl peptidase
MRCIRVLLLVFGLSATTWAGGRPMTIDDLLAVKSVSDPQISPDGKQVVYVVSELDRVTNKSNSDLWLIAIDGGTPRRLTTSPGADEHPRWSPDGKQISFVSDRGGSSQIWLLPIEGGEAHQLTKLPIDVSGPIWSPKGDKLAFTAEVYPGKTPEETAAKDKEKAEAKSKARVFDRLMIRHWSAWDEGKRSHLFVCDAKTGEAKDLTPKLEVNTPPAPFGGSSDYSFSPDGKELAFTAEPIKDSAWSTNTDIWKVSVDGGEPENLTKENPAADAQPAYPPRGGFGLLAYLSQARPGFESDLWVLKLLKDKNLNLSLTYRGKTDDPWIDLSSSLDRPIQSFTYAPHEGQGYWGGQRLIAVIDDAGSESLVEFTYGIGTRSGYAGILSISQGKKLITGGANSSCQVVRGSGDLVFVHNDAAHPAELYHAKSDGSGMKPLTHHNDSLIADLDLTKAESFTFKGADGDDVSGFLIRPPGFDKNKKYPVVFLIHGGPQGAWHDEWHARWNYALFAAPGYAVVAINPRGSTGYGQKFTDQISGDWNGRVYYDLMMGLDHVLKTYPFLDGNRVAAAGGSYGGYMVNWLAGHTPRFKALISHAGVFDLPSMYGTTEELWFPEWEFGGPPWEKPEVYRAMSPSTYQQNFQTPTLVLHGALDFRVPDAQGLGMFTALQRRGVPSRYVFFPDEGHWILKAPNRVIWWREVQGWLEKYLR